MTPDTKQTKDYLTSVKQNAWIDAAPDKVYRAIVEPGGLERWLVKTAKRGTGDTITLDWGTTSFDVEILDNIPAKRVVTTWPCGDGVGDRVSFDLEPSGSGTMVNFIHSGFESDPPNFKAIINHVEGWAVYLCNLKIYLEKDFDLRVNQPPGTIIC